MAVWGNLTAESLMFLPFLLLDQALVRIAPRPSPGAALPPPLRHALLLALVCVAPLANPPQSSILDYALSGTAVNRRYNVEFAPIWAPAATVDAFGKGVAGVVLVLFLAWAAHELLHPGDRRRALRRVAPGLLACLLAVAFERNLWLLTIPAGTLPPFAREARAQGLSATAAAAAVSLGALLLVTSAVMYRWTPVLAVRRMLSPGFRAAAIDGRLVPAACVDPLERLPAVRRVYALRMWASYVIWRLPGTRVFIDGRNREYPARIHRMADEIWLGGSHTLEWLDGTGTDAVIAWPGWGESPAVRGGPWRPVARGVNCELYLRAPES